MIFIKVRFYSTIIKYDIYLYDKTYNIKYLNKKYYTTIPHIFLLSIKINIINFINIL